MGILFALTALFAWGIGDFLIQRSTRKFGDWIALLYITAIASIGLLPFIYKDLTAIFFLHSDLFFLLMASFVLLVAAILDFEALKVGKISVVEPIYAFEVPVTATLSTIVLREHLGLLPTVLIFALMIGIILVSTQLHHLKNLRFEKGVVLAILATILMGVTNFLFAIGSRTTNPLIINWFTSLFIAVIALCYLGFTGKFREVTSDFKKHKKLILSVGIIDNIAWIAYAYSVLYIPVAIAIGISESYIALAAILGIRYNKEKLQKHQYFGLLLCVISVVLLSILTG